MYERVLPDDIGVARSYAAVADEGGGRHWIVLETVPGVELYQVGESETWKTVAGWLARFHARFMTDRRWRVEATLEHLVRWDARLCETWFERARAFAKDAATSAVLARLESSWSRLLERFVALPATFLHGEFYASNVLVDERPTPARICPVDWEMAAVGPGLLDLAALTAGAGWPQPVRDAIAGAYFAAADPAVLGASDSAAARVALDVCRVQIAVQWLGWARDWRPPADNAQDWTAELSRLLDTFCEEEGGGT